jgi:hypothetical protein
MTTPTLSRAIARSFVAPCVVALFATLAPAAGRAQDPEESADVDAGGAPIAWNSADTPAGMAPASFLAGATQRTVLENAEDAGVEPSPRTYGEPSATHSEAYELEVLALSRTYTIILGILCALVFGCVFAVIWRSKGRWSRNNLAALTIPLVCFGALLLVSAGFDREQMLAPMTLFGTIVGYLLGNANAHGDEEVRPSTRARAERGGAKREAEPEPDDEDDAPTAAAAEAKPKSAGSDVTADSEVGETEPKSESADADGEDEKEGDGAH